MFKDVLADTVEECWDDVDMNEEILKKIHKQWKLVLELIVKGKGTNNSVEKHRRLIKIKVIGLTRSPRF